MKLQDLGSVVMGTPRAWEESELQSRNNKTTNGFEDLFSVFFGISLGSSNDTPYNELFAYVLL